MAKALDQFFKYNDYAIDSKEPPCYSIEEMRELISKPNDNSILPEYTTYIMDRNIAPSKVQPGKKLFHTNLMPFTHTGWSLRYRKVKFKNLFFLKTFTFLEIYDKHLKLVVFGYVIL